VTMNVGEHSQGSKPDYSCQSNRGCKSVGDTRRLHRARGDDPPTEFKAAYHLRQAEARAATDSVGNPR